MSRADTTIHFSRSDSRGMIHRLKGGPDPNRISPRLYMQDHPLKMACLILPLPKQFGCIQPCTNHICCAQRTDQVLAYIRHEDRHQCRASHVANLGVDRYLGMRRTSHLSRVWGYIPQEKDSCLVLVKPGRRIDDDNHACMVRSESHSCIQCLPQG